MPSYSRSAVPQTPNTNQYAAETDLLSRGRSVARSQAASVAKGLSMAENKRSSVSRQSFGRKSVSRARRRPISVSSLIQNADDVNEPIVYGSSDSKFYSHGQAITPGGVLNDMQIHSSGHYSASSVNSAADSEELQANVLYRNAIDEDSDTGDLDDNSDGANARRATKTERQWIKWSQEIIPILLQPYMILMEETQSLRDTSALKDTQHCQGCEKGRIIHVSCLFFNSKFFCNLVVID